MNRFKIYLALLYLSITAISAALFFPRVIELWGMLGLELPTLQEIPLLTLAVIYFIGFPLSVGYIVWRVLGFLDRQEGART